MSLSGLDFYKHRINSNMSQSGGNALTAGRGVMQPLAADHFQRFVYRAPCPRCPEPLGVGHARRRARAKLSLAVPAPPPSTRAQNTPRQGRVVRKRPDWKLQNRGEAATG